MKKLGIVTEEEIKQISALFNEKAALCDLIISMGRASVLGIELDKDEMYHRLTKDMQQVIARINEWWSKTAEHYGWKYQNADRWSFDLATREVFLDLQVEQQFSAWANYKNWFMKTYSNSTEDEACMRKESKGMNGILFDYEEPGTGQEIICPDGSCIGACVGIVNDPQACSTCVSGFVCGGTCTAGCINVCNNGCSNGGCTTTCGFGCSLKALIW